MRKDKPIRHRYGVLQMMTEKHLSKSRMGDEVVSNYMDSSNVKYGVHHNDKYQTYAQRMQVRFTATSDKAVLTLAAEEGKTDESVVDFDDVRVMKVNPSTNPEPVKYTYWEDFENVDQGYGCVCVNGV